MNHLTIALALPILANLAADPCKQTADDLLQSCKRQAPADFLLATARCRNLQSSQERAACFAQAYQDLSDALQLCFDQHQERIDVCGDLGGGFYAPMITPANFVKGVNHPYFPLQPGVTLVYDEHSERGIARDEVTTTHETKVILGVTCTEVHDVVSLNGMTTEDTTDWFAQDVHGNVWYFGELSMSFDDGQLVSLEGSWKAGVDGALPGIVMKAQPHVGDVYRQEYLIGEAEDIGEVLSLSKTAITPFGTFHHCVQTEDQSPMEPGVEELKYFAAGVGFVFSTTAKTGELVELVDIVQR